MCIRLWIMGTKETSIIVAVLALGAVACEQQSAKRPVKVTIPQQQVLQTAAPLDVSSLPLDARRVNVPNLMPPLKSAVEYLIEKVEAAFVAGEQNYKAGHLEKARRDFDRAVDWLLMSGMDVHSDARLEQLFDRIVNTVHTYETAAFREGDGFNEQRVEPAAIDEISDMTFPVDPRLKEKAERELLNLAHDLPITLNDHVLSYLNFFQTPRGRAIVERGLQRAGRYREMIARVLREEGLPQDLIYLAQAESAFLPQAVSRMRAVGMWQFMSYTGREYGLKRTWWTDDRQDPEKATRAAARHLRELYSEFNDWHLAIAAYNSGAANVSRGIERTGYADFWELYNRNVLPKETRNYVPIILALTLIAKDPARYGIQVNAEAPVEFDRVKPGYPIDLRLVAETVDASVDTLKQLNPHLLRNVTPRDPEFELHLPPGTAERFFAEIAAIPQEKWVSWRRHRVEEGESLSVLAQKYRVPARAIADANGIEPGIALQVGEKIIIPATAAAQAGTGKLTRYRVRRGDTLDSIASQFSVSVNELRQWNTIRGNTVARGVTLKVYPGGRPVLGAKSSSSKKVRGTTSSARSSAGASAAGSESAAKMHRVQPGETLWSIARAYQTTVESLRSANKFLFNRQLQVGDQLTILPPR